MWSSDQDWVILLLLKVTENFIGLIFRADLYIYHLSALSNLIASTILREPFLFSWA